jgi:ABC-type dipeptide/oligopeptide/nickel transport system permease subunit
MTVSEEIALGTSAFREDRELHAGDSFGRRLAKLGTVARQNPLGTLGFLIIVIFVFTAIFAPVIAPYSPTALSGPNNDGITGDHIFGTERLGRDIFSRVVYGSRISLSVAVVSVLLGGSIGILFGIISGYMGGFIDSIFQRTVDAAIAFPALLLLLIITQALGPSYKTIVFALMLAVIPGVTRVVRGAVLSEKNNQYVEAARASGAWAPRILLRHLLPNVVALGIIVMTTLLGGIILAESALSFLGLGIPNATSWGQDVSKARDSLPYHIPSAVFPGGAITLTVLGFNLLGDSIRDIFDPRLRGSR